MIINEYSSLALAYIGDAHYNMVVKRYVIDKEAKSDKMQKHANRFLSAKAQCRFAEYLIANDMLSQEELDIFKRGRNNKTHKAPKNTDIVTYHMSTGFEALWGYWYLNGDEERLSEIWKTILMLEDGQNG